MKKLVIQKNTGFTLVEVLVAIAIFSLAVLSMMVILGGSLSHINYAKKKTTATYLAQEGIEYIRNLRDTFVLYETGNEEGWVLFKDHTSDCFGTTNSKFCYFNPLDINFNDETKPIIDMDIFKCIDSSCEELYYNPANLKYNYTTGVPSGFVRAIRMVEINPDEIAVESYVFWGQGSGVQQISFREHLFNWTK